MIPTWIGIIIAAVGLVVSIGSSLLVVSFKTGQISQRVVDLDREKANVADVTAMKESLAEIKGMFVLRLRE